MAFAASCICVALLLRQVRGNGDDRVLRALLRVGFLMDAEDAVPQFDLVHFPDDQVVTAPQDGTADLGADDRLLDQDLAVVLPCVRKSGVQLARTLDLGDAEGRPGTRRFDEDRVLETIWCRCIGAGEDPELRGVDPCAPCDDVGQRLVHADRRRLDVAPHVGHS